MIFAAKRSLLVSGICASSALVFAACSGGAEPAPGGDQSLRAGETQLTRAVVTIVQDASVIPPRAEFSEFPTDFDDGWSCVPEEMEQSVINELGVTDFLLCNFVRPAADRQDLVGVYIGYHATQVRQDGGTSENSIHPPAHCLPGSGWDIIQNETVPLEIPGVEVSGATAKRLLIAKGEARQLVYYWYHSRGRVISQDWKKIIFVGLDRAQRGRTDGSLVRFTIPIRFGDVEAADAAFYDLAPSHQSPKPLQKPHPPIYFGGESDAALRRIARFGQGWFSAGYRAEEMAAPLARLDGMLAAEGRSRGDIEIAVGPAGGKADLDMVKRYRDEGVDQVVLALAGRNLDRFIENLARFRAGEPLDGLIDKKAGY